MAVVDVKSPELEAAEAARVGYTFGWALHMLRTRERVARLGWNGRGMFIYLVPASVFEVNRPPLSDFYPKGTEIEYRAHIDMKTADGSCVPWLASQTDILAQDWVEYQDTVDHHPV